jgi:hypothetical protein
MTILARTRTIATKAHRVAPFKPVPFGAGIEVDPTPARLKSFTADDVKTHIWLHRVHGTLLSFGYAVNDADAGCSWIISRGTIVGCPVIKPSEWKKINGVVARYLEPLPLKSKPVPTAPAPASAPKPVPATVSLARGFQTREGAYVPSDAESVWSALDSERLEDDRLNARWEALAQEAFEDDAMADGMLAIGACG